MPEGGRPHSGVSACHQNVNHHHVHRAAKLHLCRPPVDHGALLQQSGVEPRRIFMRMQKQPEAGVAVLRLEALDQLRQSWRPPWHDVAVLQQVQKTHQQYMQS